MNEINPAEKNKHMRRFAYTAGLGIAGLIINGMMTGTYAPEHVFYSLMGIIAAWAGASKWGEIHGR